MDCAMSKLGLCEFLSRIGDDNIKFQNVVHDLKGIQLVRKGKETQITFLTDPAFITPNDVMSGKPRYMGIVLWLPMELVEKAKAE